MATATQTAPRFKATNCAFNKANYPHLVGQTFHNPPAYVAVIDMDEAKRKDELARRNEERRTCRDFWAN